MWNAKPSWWPGVPSAVRAGAILVSVVAVAGGSRAYIAAQQSSTFRAGIDVVRVDVSVLDEHRRPVHGLTSSDFTVLSDGQPQKVVALSEIDVPDAVTPSAAWMRDATPDVATNRLRDRRVWVIIMDDATVPLDQWVVNHARSIARDIVSKMGAGDSAAIVFTRDNRASQDFTPDRAKLEAAIDRFSASGGSTSTNKWIPAEGPLPLYALQSVNTLKESATLLAGLPDRRKLLVYISSGVSIDMDQLMPTATLGTTSMSDQQDAVQLYSRASDALRAAIASNVNVYTFDPEGRPTAARANSKAQDFLRALATNTGGRAAVNSNDAVPAITEMFAENASYYLLGYQAPAGQRNKTANVEIKVNRPGTVVRARRQVETSNAANNRPTPPEVKALSGLMPVSDLPLSVAAAPFRRSGSGAGVAVVLGVLERAGTGGRESVDLITTAFDSDGKSKRSARTKGDVVFRSGIPAGDLVMYEVLSEIDLKPGRYQLRLAAHRNGTEASGSVFTDVDVPDFAKDPVSLSGVALSVMPAPASAPKNALAGLIPVTPTTLRDFSAGNRVEAFVRIYEGGKSNVQPVTMSVKFIDAHDVTVLSRREPIPAIQFLADRSAEYRVAIPVATLAPGPYMMRIEVTLGGRTAQRDVMFLVR